MTVSIPTSPTAAETAEIVRFLQRFADLMSTGASSDNLFRAARLLEAHVHMVRESNERLQIERTRNDADSELRQLLEDRIAGLEGEIAELKSQLSHQRAKLAESTAEAERQPGELAQRAEKAQARLAEAQDHPVLAVSSDSHVLVPITSLRLAEAQFVSLARAFERSGNIVSQVMCEASASNLGRIILDAGAPQEADRPEHAA